MQSQLCTTKTAIQITSVYENSADHYCLHLCKAGLILLQPIKTCQGKMDVLGW